MKRTLTVIVLAFLLGMTDPANAELLDFENRGLGNSDPISQGYGDTALVDVSHRTLDSFGSGGNQLDPSLYFYESGYGDLTNVAWGASSAETNVGELKLEATDGYVIALHSFDLGGWAGDWAGRTVRIYDENWGILQEYANQTILGNATHSSFSPNVSASKVTIQWDYPWAAAIDNVSFDTVVPEPSTIVLWSIISLIGGVIAWRTRQTP